MSDKIVVTISGHQGKVDFARLKEQGVYGVMLKCTEGRSYVSPVFKENYKAAKAAGLKVGAFHELYAQGTTEACKEGRNYGAAIQNLKLDFPVCLAIDPEMVKMHDDDTEWGEATPTSGRNIINAFAQYVEKYGRSIRPLSRMLIATTAEYHKNYFCDSDIKDYPRWITMQDMDGYNKKIRLAGYGMQEVPGIENPAVVNIYYDRPTKYDPTHKIVHPKAK